MQIKLEIDPARFNDRMRSGEKRIGIAAVNAINNTAKKAQEAIRAEVQRAFTLRKPDFVLREAAVISPFASVSQGRAFAEIGVGSPGRPKPRLLLPQFEFGGQRLPFKGKRVAVPIIGNAARPTFASSVPSSLLFTKLRLTKSRPTGEAVEGKRRKRTQRSSGERIRYGQQDTFEIPRVGVFQRKGKETQLIYAYVEDERIQPDLHFYRTVKATTDLWFGEFLEREIIRALDPARL